MSEGDGPKQGRQKQDLNTYFRLLFNSRGRPNRHYQGDPLLFDSPFLDGLQSLPCLIITTVL